MQPVVTLTEFENWRERAEEEGEIESYPEELEGADTPWGKIEKVSSHGGYEGGGEYMDIVIKIGDSYFMNDGRYNSWDAGYWNDWYSVEPYTVEVTKYKKVKA